MTYDYSSITFLPQPPYKRFIDLKGQRFGRLVVLGWGKVPTNNRAVWICECDCGRITAVKSKKLRDGSIRSCNCLATELSRERQMVYTTTEQPFSTKLKDAWKAMKGRCYNPNDGRYYRYGERGIKVCDRWVHSFDNFITDMGEPPTSKHSLERLDLDADYSPENCVWADAFQQANNTSRNVFITHNGVTQTIAQWGRTAVCTVQTFARRIRDGWDMEKALHTPTRLRTKP